MDRFVGFGGGFFRMRCGLARCSATPETCYASYAEEKADSPENNLPRLNRPRYASFRVPEKLNRMELTCKRLVLSLPQSDLTVAVLFVKIRSSRSCMRRSLLAVEY